MLDRMQPLLHLRMARPDGPVHFASYCECPSIGEILSEAACIDPVSKSQRMKLKVVREFQLTGTLSGNILLVKL